MKNRILTGAGMIAALAAVLIAVPSHSARRQEPDTTAVNAQMRALEARLGPLKAMPASQELEKVERFTVEDGDEPMVISEGGASWLGVETHEVTADSAKNLKLPAERGVVVGKVIGDSPAAKAGLKENDVITEINGHSVEGAAQFRRMIREIPAGRIVQLTVWRDGRSQQISATLGKSEQGVRTFFRGAAPGAFAFRMPEVQIPEIPNFDFNGNAMVFSTRPRLGIDAEDLNGQLGTYFGAPEGEGVLVREVNPGSPAEKGGLKAGDVITSVNGDRIHSVGDLREKLSTRHDENSEKSSTVKLGVLRNRSEVTVNVELPAPEARTKRVMTHRTNI